MYMTWELFFMFCGVILQVIILIHSIYKGNDHHDHNHKNKK